MRICVITYMCNVVLCLWIHTEHNTTASYTISRADIVYMFCPIGEVATVPPPGGAAPASQCSNIGHPTTHMRVHRHNICVLGFDTSEAARGGTASNGFLGFEPCDRVRSVTERRQYPLVVPGRPHNAQASTHWPLFIVHQLWSVSRSNVQTAPKGGSEQRISRHGVR